MKLSDILHAEAADTTPNNVHAYEYMEQSSGNNVAGKEHEVFNCFLRLSMNETMSTWVREWDLMGVRIWIYDPSRPYPVFMEESPRGILVHTPRGEIADGLPARNDFDMDVELWTSDTYSSSLVERERDVMAAYVYGNYYKIPNPPQCSMQVSLYRRKAVDMSSIPETPIHMRNALQDHVYLKEYYVIEYQVDIQLMEGSYKTPITLVDAINAELLPALKRQHRDIIRADENKQIIHDDAPLTMEKCLIIDYDVAMALFEFKPGTRFDAVSILLSPNLAHLMGFDVEETRFTVVSDEVWDTTLSTNRPQHISTQLGTH